ncbi:MAG TPA: hotdog fold thioesterase [Oligoflexia bacterium]|nr:hotdog fold thioesterase [Oligoflexia bacterium]HMP48396.1 hotdog fold thioesterase [Oligoflexia bacterium]
MKKIHKYDDTLVNALGIEFISLDPAKLSARMPVDHRTRQPFGLLHGGATAALIETLASVGSNLNVRGDEAMAVGTELNVSHVGSARDGYVVGVALPIRLGKSIHVWEVEVRKEKEVADSDEIPLLISVGRCSLFIKQ